MDALAKAMMGQEGVMEQRRRLIACKPHPPILAGRLFSTACNEAGLDSIRELPGFFIFPLPAIGRLFDDAELAI
mgnify:CR=1 FL=1